VLEKQVEEEMEGSYKAGALLVALAGIGVGQVVDKLGGRAAATLERDDLLFLIEDFWMSGHGGGVVGEVRGTAVETAVKGGRPGYYTAHTPF
jgi:hypothetical protein